MKTRIAVALAALIAAPAFAQPQTQGGHTVHRGGAEVQAAAVAEGEIRRVDRETKKLTIRHGPIASLDMPAMTMVFQVKDPALLDRVKPGDKVRFAAEKLGGAYTVTAIEVQGR